MSQENNGGKLVPSSGASRLAAAAAQLALAPAAPEEIPHHNLLRILWQRRLIVLATILLSVLGCVGYLFLATPIYSSSSRIHVQQGGPKIMSSDDSGSTRSGNYLNTECQVIRSGPILAAALDAPGIRSLASFAGETSALGKLAEDLAVIPGKNDDLITVSFESPYPGDTAQVVNAVVEAYVAHQSNRKRTTAAEVLKILQKEKVKRDAELEAALKDALDYRQKHGELGFQGEKGNIIVQRLDRLSTALTEAELELVEAKSTYEALQAMKDEPAKINQFFEAKRAIGGVYVSTQDEGGALRAELSGLRLQAQTLKHSYGAGHLTVDRIEKRMAEVQQLIAEREAALANSRMAAVQQQYEAAGKKLSAVQNAYDEQMRAALGLNSVLAEYAKLENRWEGLKKLVEQLDGRIKELNVTEDVGALNISVLEPAGRPLRPIKPDRLRAAGMASAVGILLGIGLALLRSRLDRRVTSAEEVSALLRVPVVGVLPRLKGRQDIDHLGRDVLENPSSSTAEAYRGIRTALGFSLRGLGAKTVLVTSPGPRDGKSTLISNLAFSVSQIGQRVLIVDADLRQPRQHSIFSVGNDIGLANVLAGEAPVEKAIRNFDSRCVDILPSGRTGEHSYEMLNGKVMADLLRDLSEAYDLVLIDSPPLMSVTDPLVLAAICDVTVLVVRAGWAHRQAAEQAREGLMSVGARVVGAVVTGIKGNAGRYHPYYHRYYADRQNAVQTQDDGSGAVAKT